jgi:hypothetical protein
MGPEVVCPWGGTDNEGKQGMRKLCASWGGGGQRRKESGLIDLFGGFGSLSVTYFGVGRILGYANL